MAAEMHRGQNSLERLSRPKRQPNHPLQQDQNFSDLHLLKPQAQKWQQRPPLGQQSTFLLNQPSQSTSIHSQPQKKDGEIDLNSLAHLIASEMLQQHLSNTNLASVKSAHLSNQSSSLMFKV